MWFIKKDKTNWAELGVIADPRPDEERKKDYVSEEVFGAPAIQWVEKPESRWNKFKEFFQYISSSCGAQSLAKMLGIENHIEEGKFVHFSARCPYTRRKNYPDKGKLRKIRVKMLKLTLKWLKTNEQQGILAITP